MLIKKSGMTINLNRFDFICVIPVQPVKTGDSMGGYVEAVSGPINNRNKVRIAEFSDKSHADALEVDISRSWANYAPSFNIEDWCAEHNTTAK